MTSIKANIPNSCNVWFERENDPQPTPLTDRLEIQTFQDTGCRFYARCLECPLPHCYYDETQANKRAKRNKQIVSLWKGGVGSDALKRKYNIAQRTLDRILQSYRR